MFIAHSNVLKWARDGVAGYPDFLTPLGSPIAAGEEPNLYWEKLYQDFKCRLHLWNKAGFNSQAGKILISKAMLISMATYNFSTHLPPEWLLKAIISDLDQFIWKNIPDIDKDETGSESAGRTRHWLPSAWASLPMKAGGLGTVDLRCFADGLMLAWIPRFLDPRTPKWKHIPGLWLESAMGHFYAQPKAVLLLELTAKQMSSYTHSPFWDRMLSQWHVITKRHCLIRDYEPTSLNPHSLK